MRPTKSSTTASSGTPTARAGGRPAAGGEAVEVDAGRDDEGAGGVGAVEPHELAGLLLGVGDEPVGLGHHLLLADDPGPRLGAVADRQRLVLDLREGVRGVDQRHAPPVAGEPAHLARQPVVRVDDVVVAGLVLGLLAEHGGGEGAELGGQLLLAQALEGSGADVPHRHAGGHLDDRREVAGGGAGEDVDGDAAGGEALGGLDDVDVHARRRRRRPAGRAGWCAPRGSPPAGACRSGRNGERARATTSRSVVPDLGLCGP